MVAAGDSVMAAGDSVVAAGLVSVVAGVLAGVAVAAGSVVSVFCSHAANNVALTRMKIYFFIY